MVEAEARAEVLDLLARGKISIDEAVDLLNYSGGVVKSGIGEDPMDKNKLGEEYDSGEVLKIEVADENVGEKPLHHEKENQSENVVQPERLSGDGRQPRWLRVQVSNMETGKNKVSVNIPFGMVRFGLGIARTFSPELNGIKLDEIGEMLAEADSGLLVDVQDDESNEHVRIFFD